MLFIENPNTNPYINHALEEWLIDNTSDDCFMLWRNKPAILLGRHQNAYAEVNLEYAAEHNIYIVRRITGGGTVFTDDGNIMFTFISRDGDDFSDFNKFTAPIIEALREMGVPAEFCGRNDLCINGKKFSGNAQARHNGALLHHGTLMYSAGIGELGKALNVRPIKLASKGVKSVASRVTNISEHMDSPPDIESFRKDLFDKVQDKIENAVCFRLSDEDWRAVFDSAYKTHATKEWIYGSAPAFNIHKEAKLPGGLIECYFDVSGGRIIRAKIFGDFFFNGDITVIEKNLIGVLYEREELLAALIEASAERHFRGISAMEITDVMIG